MERSAFPLVPFKLLRQQYSTRTLGMVQSWCRRHILGAVAAALLAALMWNAFLPYSAVTDKHTCSVNYAFTPQQLFTNQRCTPTVWGL